MLIAAAFTIIALPAIWLFTRGEASSGNASGSIAAAGIDTPTAVGPSGTTATDPLESSLPIFIDGPAAPPKPAVIQIVVPSVPQGQSLEGGASFRQSLGAGSDSCSAPNTPYGAVLTVTNRNNGRSVVCVNRSPEPLAAGVEIVLTMAQFSEIGQPVDSPIPVRISWQAAG